jgi:hypothetical protein
LLLKLDFKSTEIKEPATLPLRFVVAKRIVFLSATDIEATGVPKKHKR